MCVPASACSHKGSANAPSHHTSCTVRRPPMTHSAANLQGTSAPSARKVGGITGRPEHCASRRPCLLVTSVFAVVNSLSWQEWWLVSNISGGQRVVSTYILVLYSTLSPYIHVPCVLPLLQRAHLLCSHPPVVLAAARSGAPSLY
jgi:hypothetical protein